MLKQLYEFLKDIFADKFIRRCIFIIIVCMIIILVWAAIGHSVETFGTCVAKCRTDIMYVHECVEDERGYWEGNVPDTRLKNACIDLIRNERIN